MQLREIVDAATADEPPLACSTDEIIAAGRRAERRRRAGFASAGAAGLVAVVVAGTFALSSVKPSTPEPVTGVGAGAGQGADVTWPDAQGFTFTFRAFEAGGFHVQDPIVASTAYQIAPVYQEGRTTDDPPTANDLPTANDPPTANDLPTIDDLPADGKTREQVLQKLAAGKQLTGGTLYAYLTLYRPGAFDPSGITGGTSLVVAGRRAVESTRTAPAGRQLAWEYADNAWAVVNAFTSSPAPSLADLSALVTALKPSPAEPAKLPFTVGYVPSGYLPVEIGMHAMPGLNGIAAARDGDYGGATYANPVPATTGLTEPYGGPEGRRVPGSFSIFVTPSSSSNQKAKAGETECYQQTGEAFCNVWSADGNVQVQVVSSGQLSATEITRIAESVKVADVRNEATWTSAAEALQP
ncbi:hypothetical protein ACN28C_00200 [Plantactinospora sp. WMMC1484]|uniref:hypothetical protein n=1 Tax=Plantactinospora sp. WMMC1484 TaxID=3404122 RepID=UPI003BF588D9